MPSIQIKGVPDQVHRRLKERAMSRGQSLQEYLLDLLTAEAGQPTLDELFARIDQHTDGNADFASAAQAIRADRDSR